MVKVGSDIVAGKLIDVDPSVYTLHEIKFSYTTSDETFEVFGDGWMLFMNLN